jgi:hypothetical protein
MSSEMSRQEEKVNKWLGYINGHIEGTKRRQRYSLETPLRVSYTDEGHAAIRQEVMEVDDCYVVTIPIRVIEGFVKTQEWYEDNRQGFARDKLDHIIRAHHAEVAVREDNPAVQKAYAEYRLLLKLSTSDNVDPFVQPRRRGY